MAIKNKRLILIQRIFLWAIYFYSGFILYFEKGYLLSFLMSFAKIVYPLSIFWIQIRLKKQIRFLPINESMSTAQLWFNILPVLASFFVVILTLSNFIFFILNN